MFFDDIWVYFAFTINWTAPEQSDPTTGAAWVAASRRALQLVKDALAR